MRLFLLILCPVFALMPPGVCVCHLVEKPEAVERAEPVRFRCCCHHTQGSPADGVPAVNKTATGDRHEPADNQPHRCRMCEQLPATLPPAAERVPPPDVTNVAVLPPVTSAIPSVEAGVFVPFNPPDTSPRFRLHLLCALRM